MPRLARLDSHSLREACRWLRDDIRSGLHLRDVVMPEFLQRVKDEVASSKCHQAASDYARSYPKTPPFASLAHWAPYICSGLGYTLNQVT